MIAQASDGFGAVGNDMYAPYDPGTPRTCRSARRTSTQAKSLLKAGRLRRQPHRHAHHLGRRRQPRAVAAAQVFAEQAKGAGVTVKVNKVDSSVFYGDQYLKWTVRAGLLVHAQLPRAGRPGHHAAAPYNETHWNDRPSG